MQRKPFRHAIEQRAIAFFALPQRLPSQLAICRVMNHAENLARRAVRLALIDGFSGFQPAPTSVNMPHPILMINLFALLRLSIALHRLREIGLPVIRVHEERQHLLSHCLNLFDGIAQNLLDAVIAIHVFPFD